MYVLYYLHRTCKCSKWSDLLLTKNWHIKNDRIPSCYCRHQLRLFESIQILLVLLYAIFALSMVSVPRLSVLAFFVTCSLYSSRFFMAYLSSVVWICTNSDGFIVRFLYYVCYACPWVIYCYVFCALSFVLFWVVDYSVCIFYASSASLVYFIPMPSYVYALIYLCPHMSIASRAYALAFFRWSIHLFLHYKSQLKAFISSKELINIAVVHSYIFYDLFLSLLRVFCNLSLRPMWVMARFIPIFFASSTPLMTFVPMFSHTYTLNFCYWSIIYFYIGSLNQGYLC